MATTFLLSLVRHGETEANKDRIIQGQRDVPMSVVGRSQAAKLGARLAEEEFTIAYSSDLQRARETADIILSCNRRVVPIVDDPRLRERNFGDFQGKAYSKFIEEAKKNNLSVFEYTPYNGESRQNVQKRAVEFFNHVCTVESERESVTPVVSSLLGQYSTEEIKGFTAMSHVLVTSHGGALSTLLEHFATQYCCKMPGDCRRTSPNTGLSLFAVTVSRGVCSSIVCLCLHDKTHLNHSK